MTESTEIDIPDIRSSFGDSSAVAALYSVAEFFDIEPTAGGAFEHLLEVSQVRDAHPSEVEAAAKDIGLTAKSRMMDAETVRKSVEAGIPVLCVAGKGDYGVVVGVIKGSQPGHLADAPEEERRAAFAHMDKDKRGKEGGEKKPEGAEKPKEGEDESQSDLVRDLMKEIEIAGDKGASIGVLAQDYGRDAVHEMLKKLRREGKVRLVAAGSPIDDWAREDGVDAADYIQGDKETYIRVEARPPEGESSKPQVAASSQSPSPPPNYDKQIREMELALQSMPRASRAEAEMRRQLDELKNERDRANQKHFLIHDPARGTLHVPADVWESLYHGWGMALDDPAVKKKWLIERVKAWEESKHPRGGDAKHPGRFSAGRGGDSHKPDQPTRLDSTKPQEPETAKEPKPSEKSDKQREKLPAESQPRSEAIEKLRSTKVTAQHPLGGGANGSHVIALEGGAKAVWKPAAEENPGWNRKGIPAGSQYKREAATYALAEAIGFADLVPPTTIREVDGKEGSAQQYEAKATVACKVMDGKLLFALTGIKKKKQTTKYDGEEDLKRAAVLDYLLSSSDRHDGNWMLTEDKRLKLIDNGACLPTNYDDKEGLANRMLLEEAQSRGYAVPKEIAGLADKWPDMEKAMRSHGIEDEAIALAKERLDILTEAAKAGKKFSELPGIHDFRKAILARQKTNLDLKAYSRGAVAKTWDESKHPRGHEGNPGQFSSTSHGGKAETNTDDRPKRPEKGFASAAAASEHGRKMAESHYADPQIRKLRERLSQAESYLNKAVGLEETAKAKEELKKLQDAWSHESRRSMLLSFTLPLGEQARLQADVSRPNSPQGKSWEQASLYLGHLLSNQGPGDQKVWVRAATRGRAYYNYSEIYTTKTDDASISAHEFGHHLEESPWVRERVQEFRKKRFDDTKTVSMREKFSGYGYGKDENGNADDMNKLFGNDNSAHYCGKTYDDGRTEIVSMGLEMLYKDPAHFARTDPEYFGLIVSILQEPRKK